MRKVPVNNFYVDCAHYCRLEQHDLPPYVTNVLQNRSIKLLLLQLFLKL